MNESTRLDKLSLLMGYISGQVKILDNIADMEDDDIDHPFVDNNYLKGSIYGAIDTLATEAGSIVDWLRNREENIYVEDLDEMLEGFFGSESKAEPEQMVVGCQCYKPSSFNASSCHDYGTEPLSDTVTKETMCGYNIIGPDNKVRFKNISKTFVRMIRDSPYAQDEQLWVAKDGLVIPGVVGIMKIDEFK